MDAQERIEELADQVVAQPNAYYQGAPLVADAEYDTIEYELRALIEAHPELAPDPNPLGAGGCAGGAARTGSALRPMLSLEKATKPEQVVAFFDRFPGQPVVVMPKLDGLRSTFAAYNAAHPDRPLINPRNVAAGTLRAKDPAAVAERRL